MIHTKHIKVFKLTHCKFNAHGNVAQTNEEKASPKNLSKTEFVRYQKQRQIRIYRVDVRHQQRTQRSSKTAKSKSQNVQLLISKRKRMFQMQLVCPIEIVCMLASKTIKAMHNQKLEHQIRKVTFYKFHSKIRFTYYFKQMYFIKAFRINSRKWVFFEKLVEL